MNPAAAVALTGFMVGCGTAAWLDLITRRIPNWLCAIIAVVGLAFAAFDGGLAMAGHHALHFLVGLLAGMVLFRLGMIGGGDAKFYAAVGAWFSLVDAPRLVLSVALWGGVLVVIWFGYRRLKRLPISNQGGTSFDSLPYGLAIAAGGVSTALL